jgi:hypothetical protein
MSTKAADLLDRTGARKLFTGVRRWARQFNSPGGIILEEIPNRRSDERKTCSGAICIQEITENNAPGRSLPASVLNVSKRGLCVLVDEPLSKGSLVMLDLSGRAAAGSGRSLLAHVTRIQRASGQAGYVIGLKRHSSAA